MTSSVAQGRGSWRSHTWFGCSVALVLNGVLAVLSIVPLRTGWRFLSDFVFARLGWTTANPSDVDDGPFGSFLLTGLTTVPVLALFLLVNLLVAAALKTNRVTYWLIAVVVLPVPALVRPDLWSGFGWN
ncbi:hypothetical protein [Kitasatospora sp. NPDC093102]|uniref:hypothetical protein n=1 Tax=Kitasatospora sp. NPDC093102 TaxID=3155069 RepID=UPI00341DAC07